jgi:hypothetical protein
MGEAWQSRQRARDIDHQGTSKQTAGTWIAPFSSYHVAHRQETLPYQQKFESHLIFLFLCRAGQGKCRPMVLPAVAAPVPLDTLGLLKTSATPTCLPCSTSISRLPSSPPCYLSKEPEGHFELLYGDSGFNTGQVDHQDPSAGSHWLVQAGRQHFVGTPKAQLAAKRQEGPTILDRLADTLDSPAGGEREGVVAENSLVVAESLREEFWEADARFEATQAMIARRLSWEQQRWPKRPKS